MGGFAPQREKNPGRAGGPERRAAPARPGWACGGPRHRGYRQSQKRRKTVGGGRKLRFVGRERNRGWLELTAAAYNLVRMAGIEAAVA